MKDEEIKKIEEQDKNRTVDEIIEILFTDFFFRDLFIDVTNTDFKLHPKLKYKLLQVVTKLTVFGIVSIVDNKQIILQKEGYKVLELGGWFNYLDHLKNLERQENADRVLARQVNESVKTTNKNQIVILYLTIVVSVVSLILSVLTYCKNDPQDVRILSPIAISKSDTLNVKVISRFQTKTNDSAVFSKKP